MKENDDDHGETQYDHDHVKFDAPGHLFVGPVDEASGLLETDGGALVQVSRDYLHHRYRVIYWRSA